MKNKKLELKKTIEMIKQNTYEKNPKKTQTRSSDFKPRKKMKKDPIQRMERFDTRPKNNFTNEKPCIFCNAPNWNPTHKSPTLGKHCNKCGKKGHFGRVCRQRENYKRKVRIVTEDESEASIHRIKRINRISDRNKYLTTIVKVNGIEKKIVDTGSPTLILHVDEHIKETNRDTESEIPEPICKQTLSEFPVEKTGGY